MILTDRLISASASQMEKLLPNRIKRLIILASLTGYICDKKMFTKETLRKLNDVMSLSSNDNALVLPLQFSKLLWKNRLGSSILNPNQTEPHTYRKVSDEELSLFADRVPQWLKYADHELIFNDIKKLF